MSVSLVGSGLACQAVIKRCVRMQIGRDAGPGVRRQRPNPEQWHSARRFDRRFAERRDRPHRGRLQDVPTMRLAGWSLRSRATFMILRLDILRFFRVSDNPAPRSGNGRARRTGTRRVQDGFQKRHCPDIFSDLACFACSSYSGSEPCGSMFGGSRAPIRDEATGPKRERRRAVSKHRRDIVMVHGKKRPPVTRRHFLYALGSLAGVGIGGWVLSMTTEGRAASATARGDSGKGPMLRVGLVVSPSETGAEVYDRSSGKQEGPVCFVNRLGLRVLESMDGERTIDDIARGLLGRLRAPPSDAEAFTSSVAMFMAELGSAGLLNAPFFVNIHSREVSA